MAKTSLEDLSTDELRAKLKAIKTIQNAVLVIFGVIILGWIVPGYWRENIPVFISTVAMAIAIGAMHVATRRSMVDELRKRNDG